MTPALLSAQFASYVQEACRLQTAYQSQIQLFVGVETELCREESLDDVIALKSEHALDYMVGSVHHVAGIPIDFNEAKIQAAQDLCGGLEPLALQYFRSVTKMIETLQPDVVGHLDLIRLLRPTLEMTPAVMEAVEQAVTTGVSLNCVFEINSAGLRKGLQGPYPHADVLKVRAISDMCTIHVEGDWMLSELPPSFAAGAAEAWGQAVHLGRRAQPNPSGHVLQTAPSILARAQD
jgi:histidinol-phosphatase (PHP family)